MQQPPARPVDPVAAPPTRGTGAEPPAERDRSRLVPAEHEVVRAGVGTLPVRASELAAAVARRSAGAVVTFEGVVRDHDHGRPVTAIEYVAHPSAQEVVARVAADVAARADVEAVAVEHRVGPLAVGDCALAVAVAAAHRAEAFEAAALLVDEVKRLLPVWKRQVFADGTDEWVACP